MSAVRMEIGGGADQVRPPFTASYSQVNLRVADETLVYALEYARRDWPIFPLIPREKRPACPHGLNDATCDVGRIERWWSRHPDHGIGIRTGVMFDVVDFDSIDACDHIDEYAPDGEVLIGPMVWTGKGLHIYIAPTGFGNKTAMLPSLDYRGAGGYVCAPPSIHPSGVRYEWTDDWGPDTDLMRSTAWLLALIDPPRVEYAPDVQVLTDLAGATPPAVSRGRARDTYARAALERELGRLIATPQGQRNHQLNTSAFSLGGLIASGHLDGHETAHALLTAARACGLDEREAIPTIKSGLRSGQQHPRQVSP